MGRTEGYSRGKGTTDPVTPPQGPNPSNTGGSGLPSNKGHIGLQPPPPNDNGSGSEGGGDEQQRRNNPD